MRRTGLLALGTSFLLVLLGGCQRADAVAGALPALRPLDAAHAAEFVRTFDEAKDRPRYVVALSPT